MKRIMTLFGIVVALLIIGSAPALSQQKVTEKKLLGSWKLVIEIEEALEEAEEELDEEDNIFGEIILRGVSGLVEGIMENIEIYFEFEKGGDVRVITNAFGEEEIEYASWYINSRGELYIEDSDNIQMDDDDYWMFDGKYLVAFEDGKRGKSENVYMTRIE